MDSGEREEVTAAAIARLAGVGRAAVSNWRKRYPEFPKPVGGSDSSPTFDRAEVEAWLIATGKASQLATAGRTDTGTERIAEPERSLATLNPGELLARSMAALLPRETADDPDGPDDGIPVVIDPACGTGTLLLAVADRFGDRVRLAGQDIDETLAKTAVQSFSDRPAGTEYAIHAGDSLLDNQLAPYLGRASAVVCEPPFDKPQWPSAELTTDPRWEFGIPAPRDGELAWVQHCYAHLRPRGTAIVAVSARTCVQQSGEAVRDRLIRSGVLMAVIALPRGMTTVPGTDLCLWILRRPHGQPDAGPVRMIDLSGVEVDGVPRDFAAWRRLLAGADPAVTAAVPRIELLDGGANVLPTRHVVPPVRVTAGDLADMTERITRLYSAIGRNFPVFEEQENPVRIVGVTLAELERAGALTIRPRDATPRRGDVLLRTMGRPPVVAGGGPDDDIGVAQVVEIDETRLDAHFVAVFLRADVAAMPVANTLGAVSREDLRRCRVPRMPMAEQCRYGDAFRRLLELDTALRKLADISGTVIEQVLEGLTVGVLAPGGGADEGETR